MFDMAAPTFDRHAAISARLELGMSRTELATLAGISRQHVQKIEEGHSVPSERVAVRIAEALQVGTLTLWQVAA